MRLRLKSQSSIYWLKKRKKIPAAKTVYLPRYFSSVSSSVGCPIGVFIFYFSYNSILALPCLSQPPIAECLADPLIAAIILETTIISSVEAVSSIISTPVVPAPATPIIVHESSLSPPSATPVACTPTRTSNTQPVVVEGSLFHYLSGGFK